MGISLIQLSPEGSQEYTMPPHMHPRSRFTSSLFATTLFASFFVVVLPHALPCPAPRVVYAVDGTRVVTGASAMEESRDDIEDVGLRRQKRECPVPKPIGLVGEILVWHRFVFKSFFVAHAIPDL